MNKASGRLYGLLAIIGLVTEGLNGYRLMEHAKKIQAMPIEDVIKEVNASSPNSPLPQQTAQETISELAGVIAHAMAKTIAHRLPGEA